MHKVVLVHVLVHVGRVKIYVAAVEALRKKERRGKNRIKQTQFGTKSGAFLSLTPHSH
jgi:hypothetical protein